MGKVIEFPKPATVSRELIALKEVSDSFDAILIDALENKGLEARDLAGLLAHRLGAFIRPIDTKSQLWDICEKVLKKQAVIDQ